MTAALPMGSQKITGMADPTISTDGATKNYVDTTTAAFFSTGDIKFTLKLVADSGWVMFDDGTIGSASSGSSTRANADTQALFTLLFNNIATDSFAPIFTSGGGATTRAAQTNAATAWAANCRLSLTKTLGRALAISGAGSGLTSRSFGQFLGEENHTLSASELPTINSSGSNVITVTSTSPSNTILQSGGPSDNFGSIAGSGQWDNITRVSVTSSASNNIAVASTNTSGGSHNTMQPTAFLNAMVKL